MATCTIEKVLNHAQRIKAGEHDTIKPGQPFRIPDAWMPGDCGAQGDLIIVVIDKKDLTKDGYKLVNKPKEADRQLVPGNTEGAKHCLDSLDGVKIYRRDDWGPDSLDGPKLLCEVERVIEHPTHGAWTISAGTAIKLEYARERDALLKLARRNAD